MGRIINSKSLNINNHCGGSFKINTQYGYYPLAFYPFCPKVVISSLPLLRSGSQFASLPKGSYLVTYYTTSIFHLTTSTPSWWHLLWLTALVDPEKTAAICGFWNVFPLGESFGDLSGLLLPGPKLSCSIEVVTTNR